MSQKLMLLVSVCICVITSVSGQGKKKTGWKDSLDHAFDLSDWIIYANGFVPVPIIITEPAVGGFGLGLVPVFLKKNQPLSNKDGTTTQVPPDITAALAGYTANKSWFAGAGRFATIEKLRIRYKAAIAYGNVNISFYNDSELFGEQEFKFNCRFFPIYLYGVKQLPDPRWLVGLQYLFVNTKLEMQDNGNRIPEFVKEKELNSNIGEVGLIGEFDTRDNIFTPDKGIKAHAHVNFSENFFGSDYDYQRLNSFFYWYFPFSKPKKTGKNWISGMRLDFQQIFGDPPFYIKPYINLRGVPVARYQGNTNILVETEQRWDFVRRWSAVFFGGLGKAFDDYSDFSSVESVYNFGGGFRYLIARKFKLRMGIDVAKGPTNWAYYIVFGNAWLR